MSTIRRVAIIGGNRIPFARSNTVYSHVSNQDMLTATLQGLVDRFNLHGERLGDVAAGAVMKHSRDFNLVRESVLSTTLSPETLRRLACDAEILPIVMDGASVPLDAGRKRREPTPTQRAAVAARDRHCRFPGCRVPAAWCQMHHIVHWARGGSTNLDNLILACHEHHRALHEGGWNAVGPADRVQFTSPSGQPFAG